MGCGSPLRVVSTQFHNTSPLTFAVPIHLITQSFQNISKIIAPKWQLESQSFSQGLDNSLYGEIKAEGLLSIIVEETVDNRYGKIQGQDTVSVKSLRGEVLNGSSIQVYRRKDSCVPPIGCPDGKRFEFTTDEAMPSYVANEAFIASSGDLHLEGFNVSTDFGGLLSMGSMHLKAVNQVRNLSGQVLVGKNITVTGAQYLHTALPPAGMNHYNVYEGVAHSWDEYSYPQSSAALTQVLGNVYFHVNRVTIDSSHLWANGNIYDSRAPGVKNPLHLFEMITHTAPFTRTYTRNRGGGWSSSFALEIPTIRAGQTISFGSGCFVITGNVSAKNIFLSGQSLETTNVQLGGSSAPISYTQPQLYDLAQMGYEETKRNPFFKENTYGVNLVTSDSSAPQDAYDRHKLTILGGLSIPPTAQFYVQRDAFGFILNKTLGMFAKNLNISGASGIALVKKLHKNAEAEAKKAGKIYLVKEDLETAAASMIFYELLEVNNQMKVMARLLVSPSDMNSYGNQSGAMTATKDIKTHMTDYDISRSGVRKAGRDLECASDGLLAAETLKDTGSLISPEQTSSWEVARQRAQYIAERGLKLLGGDIDFTGVGVEGEKVQVKAKRSLADRPLTISSFTKDATSASQKTRSVGSTYKANTTAEMTAEENDISLMATHIEAPKTILRAINGKVALLAGVNTSSYSKVEKKVNKFWQKITQRSEQHQTYTPCVFTGDVEIESHGTTIDAVRGQTLDWINRIDQHGGPIVYNMLDELHRVESHSVQGPSAAFSMVIALAATIATSGTGAGLLGTTGVLSSAMANAAFSTLCSQAAVSLAHNNGNSGKAEKHLTSTEAFKAMGIAMATAGLTKGLSDAMGVSTDPGLAGGVTDHLQREVLRTGVGLAVNTAAGEASDNPLEDGIRGIAAGTLGGMLANGIGDLYGKALIDPVTHKILHAAVGAMGVLLLVKILPQE